MYLLIISWAIGPVALESILHCQKKKQILKVDRSQRDVSFVKFKQHVLAGLVALANH